MMAIFLATDAIGKILLLLINYFYVILAKI